MDVLVERTEVEVELKMEEEVERMLVEVERMSGYQSVQWLRKRQYHPGVLCSLALAIVKLSNCLLTLVPPDSLSTESPPSSPLSP
jgi:hypothetical protein